jgi:putative membrane protein
MPSETKTLNTPTDPRVFFAAERTLLAWLRTGLTIMALGFVISRFGLFVSLISQQSATLAKHTHSSLSAILGLSFVLFGALCIFIAAIQHQRFITTLSINDLPPRYSKRFAVILAMLITVLGCLLAAYLFITQV